MVLGTHGTERLELKLPKLTPTHPQRHGLDTIAVPLPRPGPLGFASLTADRRGPSEFGRVGRCDAPYVDECEEHQVPP